MWQKIAVLSVFLIISLVRGNPLHNDGIEESKFGVLGKDAKALDEELPTTYRLPNNSYPISYDIFLVTDIHKGDLNFSGNVMITTEIKEATDKITLHYRQTEINLVAVFVAEPLTPIEDTSFDLIPSHEFLVVNLGSTFDVGTKLLIHVSYSGKLRDDGAGFYWASYNNTNQETRFYGATQFEVTDARHAFPCYDEPGIRAIMTLTIVHDKSYTAIANTEVLIEEEEDENYVVTTFKPTPRMQTYLLAFAISDYEYVNATDTRIPQRIFATPMAIADGQADFATTVVGPILHKLEEVLGVEYPLPKMDHIALTKFNFGAMENFGLITYIDRGLLLNPALSESAKYNQQNSIISLVTHEYAHQWFGNIISPKWWQYTWLNEGFATLFANYIPSLVYPERRAMRSFFSSTIQTAFNSDGPTAWAMNHYTELPNELWSKFGGIGYQKSGCVLRMMMEVMTEPVFLEGLNNYLNASYMQAATPAELHAGLQLAYDKANSGNLLNIGDIMYTWENQAGYPLLTVRAGTGGSLVFSQNRYPVSNGEVYSIPITFAHKSNPDFSVRTPKLWLPVPTFGYTTAQTGYQDGDWLVVNIDQVGYYRVDYGTVIWRANIAQLNDDHTVINPLNRALLLDEFYLGWTQFRRVNGADAMNILKYMDKEDEFLTWARGARIFNDLRSHLFDTLVHEHFNEFIKQITKPHLAVLGYEGFDGEDSSRASLRSYVKSWSCQAFDGDCFIQENQNFMNFYNNGARGTTNFDFCHGMRLIDETTFGQLLAIVVSDRSFANRARYIENFGCSLNYENLKKLLKSTLDAGNNLNSDERRAILTGTYSKSREGLTLAFSFLDDNYMKLRSVTNLTAIIDNLAGYMNTQRSADKIFALANKFEAAQIITKKFNEEIVAKVGEMEKWIDTNIFDILDYFGVEVPTTDPTEPTTPTVAPTTVDSTQAPTTTQSPSTTPGSAQSVFISISLLAICVVASLMKSL